MKHPAQILIRPVVSEKTYATMTHGNRYIFQVATAANKIEIRQAVREAFKVNPVAVNVIRVRGKTRTRSRGRRRIVGKSPDWKKAVVTLPAGETIANLFEGL